MPTLKTERLTLREWRDDDLDALAAINADPEVMRYILDGSVRDRQHTAERMKKWQRDWQQNGFGLFAVETSDAGTFIGWAGLAVPDFLPEVLPAVEIGWRLDRRYWGHGYATEAARAALRFGFAEAGLERVVSIRHVENERSRRVMEKLGMTYEFDTVVPSYGQAVAVHAISR
jgi:RimJ/RimL family protein N-acetyltransferase